MSIKGVQELPDRSVVETKGVFILTVAFNPGFWNSVLPKLEAFYNDHISCMRERTGHRSDALFIKYEKPSLEQIV